MPGPRGRDSSIELRVLRGHDTATVREKVPSADVPEALGRIFQAVHDKLVIAPRFVQADPAFREDFHPVLHGDFRTACRGTEHSAANLGLAVLQ